MARDIWNTHRRMILAVLAGLLTAAFFYILDVIAIRNHARADAPALTRAVMHELISLLRVRSGSTRDFKVFIRAKESLVYVRYVTRNNRSQLVIIYDDPVHSYPHPAHSRNSVTLVPTAFIDVHADGTLERKLRLISPAARPYVPPLSKKSDQYHYEWVVLSLLNYLRAITVNI